jgi:beta-glucosidase
LALPALDVDIATTTGQRGWLGTWHKHESDDSTAVVEQPVLTKVINEARMLFDNQGMGDLTDLTRKWTLRLRGQLLPREKDTLFEFGLTVAGRAKVDTLSVIWWDSPDNLICDAALGR